MILSLSGTSSSEVSKQLVRLRETLGSHSLGRVLTLIISTSPGTLEDAVNAARVAAREHPMRVIVLVADRSDSASPAPLVSARLDAELRVGDEVGASEVIILRAYGDAALDEEGLVSGLLLPDAPVVTWWTGVWPLAQPSSGLALMSHRRITDSGIFPDPATRLTELAEAYRPGDTDLAWARLTSWRAQLASALDNAPASDIIGVTVSGTPDSSSTMLLSAWLHLQLGVPVHRIDLPIGASVAWGIHSVQLQLPEGEIAITRSTGVFAAVTQPGHPRLEVPLPRRALPECLAEDLRLLDPDPLFGAVITRGLPLLLSESTSVPATG